MGLHFLREAAAAWSRVLKMLQDAQRIVAPNVDHVSLSLPVWIIF